MVWHGTVPGETTGAGGTRRAAASAAATVATATVEASVVAAW
eukprot:CAMPEP_0198319426 /NCGR_PEP_ID=MMETSP1450-20131203/8554_1 /TAXON_ID=753684 ORGANISM="Madagascaria erythrocladiodes, Strain CCMP3234" /NCGR_SAMPLE_ID=MMETSP1450 /ASSEMBLY_ACC=CAM_ASM_001115 /LENGTH=41 /DNA_ID= /DNA_START= /DNA_END= /DNA_ORIENTATION=